MRKSNADVFVPRARDDGELQSVNSGDGSTLSLCPSLQTSAAVFLKRDTHNSSNLTEHTKHYVAVLLRYSCSIPTYSVGVMNVRGLLGPSVTALLRRKTKF